MAEQRVLVIGATGYIGRYIAMASVAQGFATFALVRPASESSKLELIDSLKASGVGILHGSLDDHESLIAALLNADVVISAVGIPQILQQLQLIEAMKQAGTIKRFIPSEFGQDVDKARCLKPCQEALIDPKVRVRRATEEAGIPHTYVVTNGFAKFHFNMQEENGKLVPPRGEVVVYGDGNTKSSFVAEQDIGTYTIKAAMDPRTLNKTLHIRPPENALTQNETFALVETVTGRCLEKQFMSAEEILTQIEEAPGNFKAVVLSLMHAAYIKGDTFGFQLGPEDVVAHELYPEVQCLDGHTYLKQFLRIDASTFD